MKRKAAWLVIGTTLGGLFGFVITFWFVYWFVEADMVLLYYIIGAVAGASLSGLTIALRLRRPQPP